MWYDADVADDDVAADDGADDDEKYLMMMMNNRIVCYYYHYYHIHYSLTSDTQTSPPSGAHVADTPIPPPLFVASRRYIAVQYSVC